MPTLLLPLLLALRLSAAPARALPPAAPERPLRELSLEQLMDVEVTTVLRTDSTVGRSPAAVFVITAEMIRRSGADSVPELLRLAPGLVVARMDGNKWAVSARGLNDRFAKMLLVQLDGRVLYNPLFSGVYWDAVDVPLEDIERIEVVRGPGASVWGANAVNGVINIITKPAAAAQGGLLAAGSGGGLHGSGSVRHGGRLGASGHYRIYGKGFARGENFAADGDAHDGWRARGGGLRLDGRTAGGDDVSLDLGLFRSAAGRRDVRPMPSAPFSFTNLETEASHGGHASGRWSRRVDEETGWSVQAYWDRFARSGENGLFDFSWDTFDVDFERRVPLGSRQALVYGADLRVIDAALEGSSRDGGFITSFGSSRRRPVLASVFLQDRLALAEDGLSLTLGTKLERNGYTGFEAQPGARLLWTPDARRSAWAACSRAVRTPALAEDEIRLTLPPSAAGPLQVFPRTVGNTAFESEEVFSYELGARAQVTEGFSADAALFHLVYSGLRARVPEPLAPGPTALTRILPLVVRNGLDGESWGAELAALWAPAPRWRLQGAYSLVDTDLRPRDGVPNQADADEDNSPRHQASLRSSWDLARGVELDLTGRFVDRVYGFNRGGTAGVDDEVPAYAELDARVGWRPRPDLELSLVGTNLLHDHHPEFGTSPLVRSPLVALERRVTAQVSWRF